MNDNVKNIKTEQPAGTQSPQEAQYIKGSLEWRKPLANYKGGAREGQGSTTQFRQWLGSGRLCQHKIGT